MVSCIFSLCSSLAIIWDDINIDQLICFKWSNFDHQETIGPYWLRRCVLQQEAEVELFGCPASALQRIKEEDPEFQKNLTVCLDGMSIVDIRHRKKDVVFWPCLFQELYILVF